MKGIEEMKQQTIQEHNYHATTQRKIPIGRNRCVRQNRIYNTLDCAVSKGEELRIRLTDTSISTNGNFVLCGRVFQFFMCRLQSLLY